MNYYYHSLDTVGARIGKSREALVRSGCGWHYRNWSVAALYRKAEIEGDMGDSHVSLQARFIVHKHF